MDGSDSSIGFKTAVKMAGNARTKARPDCLAGQSKAHSCPLLQHAFAPCTCKQPSRLQRQGQGLAGTCRFPSRVLPWSCPVWEMRSVLISFLMPKLSAPIEDDVPKGILDAIAWRSAAWRSKSVKM